MLLELGLFLVQFQLSWFLSEIIPIQKLFPLLYLELKITNSSNLLEVDVIKMVIYEWRYYFIIPLLDLFLFLVEQKFIAKRFDQTLIFPTLSSCYLQDYCSYSFNL